MAAPAAAQPATQPSSCEVTISRAPDEVREAIEAWVNAEPRCSTTIDVRVVPTDGGFYIFARDGAGRVRERVVPDAQSAGVLVASWVADDLIAQPRPAPAPEPAPVPTHMPPSATLVLAAPSGAPGIVASAQPAPARGRWLTLGGIWQMHGQGAAGARAELDLKRRGKWSLGAVLSMSSSDPVVSDDYSSDYITTVDFRVLAALARTQSLGKRWDLRLAVGAGVTTTHARGQFAGVDIEGTGMFPTGEASLLFSREIGTRWAFAAGPVVTWCPQTYKIEDDFGGMITLSERSFEVMAFGGIRRRL